MDEFNIIECSCQGNNPDCYNCGGKGFLTKGDLIPDYKKFSYPSSPAKISKVQHNSKDYKKPKVPNVLVWLEKKKSKKNKIKPLTNKDILLSKISKPFSNLATKKPIKKQWSKGHNDKNKADTKFTSSEKSGKNRTTTWSSDQLLLMERIKENIKFMEPHYNGHHQLNNKNKKTQSNPYKMRGKNLSGTVHKNKPIYDDKIDHKLDGSKDYWQYRESGKYGSHADYDDMGDESNP